MSTKLSIDDVNKLSSIEFVNIFKNVVELWPKAAELVFLKHPFKNRTKLITHFNDYLKDLNINNKVAVLQSHPDLAGKLLDEKKLSNESTDEQMSAGLNQLTVKQSFQMLELNTKYKQKFGFPFVICVRQNNKIDCILDGFRNRLPNNRDQEINNGIEEVKRICQLRIEDIVNL